MYLGMSTSLVQRGVVVPVSVRLDMFVAIDFYYVLDIKQETGIVLSPYQDSYLSNIDFDKMNFYERYLVARVFGNKGQPLNEVLKDVFDELSDFLHANQVLAIGLNPSKYYLCSRQLYNTINANTCGTKSLFVKSVTAKAT